MAEKLDIIRPVLIDLNATMIRTIVTDSLQLSTMKNVQSASDRLMGQNSVDHLYRTVLEGDCPWGFAPCKYLQN